MSTTQEYIDKNKDTFIDELFELLRIPSVSTDSSKKDAIHQAADFLIDQLQNLELNTVKKFETPGNPIVYAEHSPHKDRPTVLIYGHYDVQPSDPDHLWDSPALSLLSKTD